MPEGRGFDSRWCHWDFVCGQFQPLTEMSTRIVSWVKSGRCVRLTTLPPSCTDCLDIWPIVLKSGNPNIPGTLRDGPGLTYLLTPWCRVLLEKLTGLQLVKKFPAFYGTRRFITAFRIFRHPSLSWASPIQTTCPQPTSWRSILILSTHLRLCLPSGLFPSGFPTRTL